MVVCAGLVLGWPPHGSAAGGSPAVPNLPVQNLAASGGLSAQPVLGLPATQVKLIGASPGEAAGEVWGQGAVGRGAGTVIGTPATIGTQTVGSTQQDPEQLIRYTAATQTWQVVPLDDASGNPITFDWAASEVDGAGGLALVGTDTSAANGSPTLVTRDPGGPFAEAPPPPPPDSGTAPVLLSGETLIPASGSPTMATLDEGGHTGVLIAPGAQDPSTPGVLHYVSGQWTREPICATFAGGTCAAPNGQVTVDAVSASSASNAWLVANVAPAGGSGGQSTVELFQRQSGSSPAWVQVQPASWLLGSGAPPQSNETAAVASGSALTASGQGVWVDFGLSAGNQAGSATVFVSGASGAQVAGTWCYPTSMCTAGTPTLGAPLPSGYGSFAWAGNGAADPGTRIITGLPQAAVLRLSSGSGAFSYQITGGDEAGIDGGGISFGPGNETLTDAGQAGGAAFDSPTEGWLGTGLSLGENHSAEVEHLTTSPSPDTLSSWPVTFRQPLLALATAPGTTPGTAGAQALAVGVNGEIARYQPGQGWSPEFIYNTAGVVQTPLLRGVAWPTTERAFAVGDGGAMFVYRSETGLWEPDPAKPLNFHANLTAIAFNPNDSNVGYAVGKQGTLLVYGKSWSQAAIPASLSQANFTSISFAGNEALVGYRMLAPDGLTEEGGILENSGSGWTIDPSAQTLLATLPASVTAISKVAGLPDGGAAAAGPGVVLERDSASAPWRFSSEPLADAEDGNVSALAAVRDGSVVRALVSVDDEAGSDPNATGNLNAVWQAIDNPPAPGVGQPPLLLGPDPLPTRGFLVRETADGWVDEELNDYPNALSSSQTGGVDLPGWPDSVFALLVDPAGDQGWAVGGQPPTGPITHAPPTAGSGSAANGVPTAGIERFGSGAAPPSQAFTPLASPSGQVSFALGGGSGCENLCADNANQGPGPDAWLRGALGEAAQIGGVRAFLYAGQRFDYNTAGDTADQIGRELADYSDVLSSGGSPPVYAAATGQDAAAAGGSAGLAAQLGSHLPAGTVPSGSPEPPAGTAAYAFDSAGASGTVRVIVVDYSAGTISGAGGAQLTWLAAQLDSAQQAGVPAIVVGSDDITNSGAPNQAVDGASVQRTLLAHGASAYLYYDDAQQNVQTAIGTGANAIPVFGTGTLGYVQPPTGAAQINAFLGASGFLLVSVNAAQRSASTNRAPVTASLVPDVGSVGIDPNDGTFLRRSQVALFEGLARRPQGGEGVIANNYEPDPYTVLPETCLGAQCSQFIKPQYTFTSSNPSVGNFVEHDSTSTNPRQVLQDSNGKPIADATSGLFCAFNPGKTTVTVATGGLSYTLPVTVQAGSVQQPCGTVPATTTTETTTASSPVVSPGVNPGHSPATQPKVNLPVKVPPPPPPVPPTPTPAKVVPVKIVPPLAAKPPVALPTIPPPILALAAPIPPKLVLPVPAITARPLPPTGYGSVPVAAPIPVRILEEEKKEEEAVESAQNNFAAYRPDQTSNLVPGVAVLLLVLAGAGGGTALRRRRPRGAAAYARIEVRPQPRARPR